MTRMAIAARLKYFRERAGLTIYEVGEKIGKSGKTVSAWECGRGQPDADMLLTLCTVYGVDSIAELYGISDEKQTAEDLTRDERFLITSYRELNRQGQEYIIQTMQMALSTYKKDSDADRGNDPGVAEKRG